MTTHSSPATSSPARRRRWRTPQPTPQRVIKEHARLLKLYNWTIATHRYRPPVVWAAPRLLTPAEYDHNPVADLPKAERDKLVKDTLALALQHRAVYRGLEAARRAGPGRAMSGRQAPEWSGALSPVLRAFAVNRLVKKRPGRHSRNRPGPA